MASAPLILIVDDGPGDRRLMQEILRESAPECEIAIAVDGADAMSYLEDPENPIPALIFLDLNMPRMDGREVLIQVKSSSRFRSIPVIVITTSDDPKDLVFCYNRHANSVLTKPLEMEDFACKMNTIVQYWLSTVRLPGLLD